MPSTNSQLFWNRAFLIIIWSVRYRECGDNIKYLLCGLFYWAIKDNWATYISLIINAGDLQFTSCLISEAYPRKILFTILHLKDFICYQTNENWLLSNSMAHWILLDLILKMVVSELHGFFFIWKYNTSHRHYQIHIIHVISSKALELYYW